MVWTAQDVMEVINAVGVLVLAGLGMFFKFKLEAKIDAMDERYTSIIKKLLNNEADENENQKDEK